MVFGLPIEYLMFGGIGFCLAWLTALMVLPAVHNRAVRLARERYDDLPLSIQEMRAEKDTIRAGFAAATRGLELQIDRLREKTVAHATDLAKKNQIVERLKQEIDTLSSALRDSESRTQTAREELRDIKRNFEDKDLTLGEAEAEIASLRRELAAKDVALREAEKNRAAAQEEQTGKQGALQAALQVAEAEIKAVSARLQESAEREKTARNDLLEAARGVRDNDTILDTAKNDIATLQRDLAARDSALRSAQNDLGEVRAELTAKDFALTRAEKEIAAIKAEISALTTLLVRTGGTDSVPERTAAQQRSVEILPFVATSRAAAEVQVGAQRPPQAEQDAAPSPVPAEAVESSRDAGERDKKRPPIDLVPGPTRLIPPSIPQSNDSVGRAFKEISDAARRADDHEPGTNQRLRAAYAPLIKTST